MARLLRDKSICLGTGYIHARLFDLGHYPGIHLDPVEKFKVLGDLFQLDDAESMIRQLDDYEGIGPNYQQPHEYQRELVKVNFDQQTFMAWTYVYRDLYQSINYIDHGDYYLYLQERNDKKKPGV